MMQLEEYGRKTSAPDEIAAAATTYYEKLFKPELDRDDDDELRNIYEQQFDMWD